MNTYSRNALISGIFTAVVLVTAVFGFSNALFNTADDVADTTQQTSKLAVKQVTQTANAQNGSCPGYSQELDNDGNCERSGNAFITVVMGTSSSTGVDANCTVSPTSTTPGTQVDFNGSGSTASSTITAYGWDFGDGNTATTTSATTNHDYGSTGNYTGSLTVVSADGNSDTVQCPEVEVSSQPPQGPTARCKAYPSNPPEPADFTFDGSASSDPNGTLNSSNFEWVINGTTYTGPVQEFYGEPQGSYNGTLTVTDDEGLQDTTSCSVYVSPPPATCTPGDPSEPPADDEPKTATSSWVDLTAGNYPDEGSFINFSLDTYQADNCYPTSESAGNQGPLLLDTDCDIDITSTSTGEVSDEYRVCVQNEPPQASDQDFEMVVNSSLNDSVDANDYDNLTYIVTDFPDHAGKFDLDNSGNFEYESTNYYGSDSFKYKVVDDVGKEASATVDIRIYNNEPEAVIDGEDSLDYCQHDQTKLTYDGSDSNDEQSDADPDVGQDGDAPDLLKPSLWNWSDSENEGYATGTAPFPPEKKYALQPPIDWPNQTDITLEVTDDEGESTDFTKSVTIDTPSYEPKITAPSTSPPTKPKLYLTANSADVRSTKATTTVTNLNQNPDFDVDGPDAPYDFSDLELDFSDSSVPNANDAFTYSTSSQPGSATGTLTFWVEDTSLPQGTYDVEVEVALDHSSFPDGPDACTYDEEAVSVEALLRVRTTAEF